MRHCSTTFDDLASRYDQLPKLPINVQSQAHCALDDTVKAHINEIHEVFNDWNENNDMPRVILRQIYPFLFWYPDVKTIAFSKDSRITLEMQSQARLNAGCRDCTKGSTDFH
jgi:midasin